MKKKCQGIMLVICILLSLFITVDDVSAKAKPSLSGKKANIRVGSKKTITVRSSVSGKIYVKSLNPSVAGVTKNKKNVKKGSPASFTVKGKYPGYAIISVIVKLKKKVKGKKEYDLRFHAYIKEKETPRVTSSAALKPSELPKATVKATSAPNSSSTVKSVSTQNPVVTSKPVSSSQPAVTTPPSTSLATVTPVITPDPYNYTVTYTHNLGSDANVTDMPDPPVVKVAKDGACTLTLPPAPHCDGYSFDSWIYLNDYRKSPGTVVTVDKDMTIKARFVRDPGYIIQYETGVQQHPEIRGVIPGKTVPYGGTLTLTTMEPSWDGHTFSGWSLKGDDTIYQPGQEISNISSNLTFYAVWDAGEVSVPTPGPEETAVLNRMLAMKSSYPEGAE